MTSSVTWCCPSCEKPLERPFPPVGDAAPCDSCGTVPVLRADALQEDKVARCPVCGLKVLYRQKDFRQAIGCLVFLVAAVFAPFTYYLSLVAAALLDLLLYRIVAEVVICYRVRCKAHIRGLAPGPNVLPFDLSIHDYYRSLDRKEAAGETVDMDAPPPPPHDH